MYILSPWDPGGRSYLPYPILLDSKGFFPTQEKDVKYGGSMLACQASNLGLIPDAMISLEDFFPYKSTFKKDFWKINTSRRF